MNDMNLEECRQEFEKALKERPINVSFSGEYNSMAAGDERPFTYDDDRLNHAFYGYRLAKGLK
jgi:hypothetical protein